MRSELEYTPATMKIVHIYEETWECRNCRKEGIDYLKQAKMDPALLQHSMASPSSVSWTMYQKYVNHVPLYRQEKDWQNLGMEIKRSTLSNWIVKISEEWLSKMYLRLHEELIKGNYLHSDKTPIQVMNEKVKGITRCLCWSHLRRYFADALPKDLKSSEATLPKEGIEYCNKLFEIEKKLNDLSPEERKIKRIELEKPVLEAFSYG